MSNDDGGGADEDGILEHDARVSDGVRQAAGADALNFQDAPAVVEVHDEEMLLREVVDVGEKSFVGVLGVGEVKGVGPVGLGSATAFA